MNQMVRIRKGDMIMANLNSMKKTNTTIKAEAEKTIDKAAATKAKVAEEVKEVKEAVKAAVEEVKEEIKTEVKAEEKAAAEAKTPVKAPVKEAPAKTTRGRKKGSTTKTATTAKTAATAKKTVEKAPATKTASTSVNVVLQFDFGEIASEEVVERCIKAYEAENKTKIKTIDVYVKPADKKAYYVVNKKSAGSIEL